jgi:alpha-beta hydrolase superfamily lysophospholipase
LNHPAEGIVVLRGSRPHWHLALALLAAGCAVPGGRLAERTTCATPAPCAPAGPSRGVVLCVPGAGGFPLICETLEEGIREQGLPLSVESFEWTHGYLRIVADQVDSEHICCQARRLAGRIVTLKCECPTRRVSLLAHSAGCLVCLEAARLLPANSLDHVILLAPAVSASYDLRPALACTAELERR